jgi:hypothetical protein
MYGREVVKDGRYLVRYVWEPDGVLVLDWQTGRAATERLAWALHRTRGLGPSTVKARVEYTVSGRTMARLRGDKAALERLLVRLAAVAFTDAVRTRFERQNTTPAYFYPAPLPEASGRAEYTSPEAALHKATRVRDWRKQEEDMEPFKRRGTRRRTAPVPEQGDDGDDVA